jgi:hypothetical protein
MPTVVEAHIELEPVTADPFIADLDPTRNPEGVRPLESPRLKGSDPSGLARRSADFVE